MSAHGAPARALALLLAGACAAAPVPSSYARCYGPAPETRPRPRTALPREFASGEWERVRLVAGRDGADPAAAVEILIRNRCGWPIGALDWIVDADTIPIPASPLEPTVLRARIPPDVWRRLPPVFPVAVRYGTWGSSGPGAPLFEVVKDDVHRGRNAAVRLRRTR